jgi:hypothetical protein
LKADVVVAGERARPCLDAVYRTGGEVLGKVIAVCPAPRETALCELQDRHPELALIDADASLGRLSAWNRGLSLRGRDVLLLDSAVLLGEGCLQEMLDVLHSSDRIASVAPLLPGAALDVAPGDVPRRTDLPLARGPCLLLRHEVLNMIGGFDPSLRGDDAQDDWAMRAQRMGFRQVRANRALARVPHPPRAAGQTPPAALLLARHPHLPAQARAALADAEARALENLLGSRNGQPRVCLGMPPEGESLDRFQVLYRPTPVIDAAELLALLDSPCHLVLGHPAEYRNGALLFAAAHSAQAVIVSSAKERAALAAELALDPARLEVVESEAGLNRVFHKVVGHPDEVSLRHRTLLADLLRSAPGIGPLPPGAVRPEPSPRHA